MSEGKLGHSTSYLIRKALERAGVTLGEDACHDLVRDIEEAVCDESLGTGFWGANTLCGTIIYDGVAPIFIDDYVISLTGYSSEEYCRLTLSELIHPRDFAEVDRLINTTFNGNATNWGSAYRMLHKDGSLIWVKAEATLRKLRGGGGEHLVINVTDVTDEMKKHQRLEETNMIYRTLMESSKEGLEVLYLNSFDINDPQNKILARNESTARIFKDGKKLYISEAEMLPLMPERQSNGELSKKYIRKQIAELIDKKYVEVPIEFIVDGELVTCECLVEAFMISGKLVLMRICRDVSQQRESEAKLVDRENVFETLVEALPGGVLITDSDEQIQYCSSRAKQLFGIDPKDDLNGRISTGWIIPEDHSKLYELYRDIGLNQGAECIVRGRRGDGFFPVEVHAKKYLDRDKGHYRFITYVSDISKRVETQENILERKMIYEALISNSFDAIDILSLDVEDSALTDANILVRNKQMQELFGDSQAVVTLNEVAELIDVELEFLRPLYREYIRKLVETGRNGLRFSLLREGRRKYFTGALTLFKVKEKIFLIRTITETTDEVEQKADMKSRQEELEKYIESNLQLENFAYIASHDLKAPLRTVLSFSQLIKRSSYDKLDDRNKEFLDIVIEGTNNMMRLIEDLLTFSRVNTQKVIFERFDLVRLQETVMLDLKEPLTSCDGEVVWEMQSKAIIADKIKLVQILENLIRNAIKFVVKGVKPVVYIKERSTDREHHFSVKDNGIGIKPDHFEKIFEVFSKLHSKDTYEGTGLGLSICARIVAQHKGRIWVESKEGEGSTFHFTISKILE